MSILLFLMMFFISLILDDCLLAGRAASPAEPHAACRGDTACDTSSTADNTPAAPAFAAVTADFLYTLPKKKIIRDVNT